jgi:phosphohistidine swiveling domain-containing protein
MNTFPRFPRFKLNYTSSSKLISMEAEHIAIASSGFSWCQIDHFVSVRGDAGRWEVYLDLPSLIEIRRQFADELLRGDFLARHVERVSTASRAVTTAMEQLLGAPPADAPALAAEYVLAFSAFLALYRGSDPVSMPALADLPLGGRRDVLKRMDDLARLRLRMRECFQHENRRFNTWLVARLRAVLNAPPDVAERLIRRVTLDELMSFPDLRDIDPILERDAMEVRTEICGRSISFDHVGWAHTAVRDGPDLASVGALTGPVLGHVYDARRHLPTLAPAGSIILISTATPDLFHGLADIKGVLALEGGYTSHAALLCRERGIPCLICPEALVSPLAHGACVRLDPHTPSVELVSE